MPEGKQKLTLTVDAETVEAAHKLGLNISEITERVLRGFTLEPDGLEKGATKEQYKDLLSTMDPLLQKYRCEVVVGDCSLYGDPQQGESVYYSGGGRLYAWEDTGVEDDDGSAQLDMHPLELADVLFLRPPQILKNFFTAIESVRARRREEIESIVLAKRLVEALNEQERNRSIRGQTAKSRKGDRK